MLFLRIFSLALLASGFVHASDATKTLASTKQAAGLVNLYFSAPLIHSQMRESKSWDEHKGLSADETEALLPEIWSSYLKSQRKARKDAFKNREIVIGDDRMPFVITRSGDTSSKRLPLTISLHGGGDMPKAQNDLQWKAQQSRYPHAPGIYVCPRAPRDTWNQWHGEHVYALMEELIATLLVYEDIDPNQIYLMGYSAGGYGAFHLGNAMPDRFAAVAASAAAPTPKQTPIEHWNNLALRFEIGEKDKAYNRVKICRTYADCLARLRRKEPAANTFSFIEHENHGHQISDQASATWLGKHQRISRPKTLVWKPTGTQVRQFYWLANDGVLPGQEVRANIDGNTITLETENLQNLTLRLDDQLVNLDEPVIVHANGMKIFQGKLDRELRSLVRTLEERGDPELAFCSELALYIP